MRDLFYHCYWICFDLALAGAVAAVDTAAAVAAADTAAREAVDTAARVAADTAAAR